MQFRGDIRKAYKVKDNKALYKLNSHRSGIRRPRKCDSSCPPPFNCCVDIDMCMYMLHMDLYLTFNQHRDPTTYCLLDVDIQILVHYSIRMYEYVNFVHYFFMSMIKNCSINYALFCEISAEISQPQADKGLIWISLGRDGK